MPERDDDPGRTGFAVAPDSDRPRPRPSDEDLVLARRPAPTFGGEHPPGSVGIALRQFVRIYGWRAYALPVLALVTVVALLTVRTSADQPARKAGTGGTHTSAPPVANGNTTLAPDKAGANANETVLKSAALPRGPAYTLTGNGTFRILKGTSKVAGTTGRLFRYTIEVENGVAGINLTQYTKLVQDTLADPRSWSGHGIRIERVDSGPVDFHVDLTSAMTVRKLCGYDIPVETSCYVPAGPTTSVNRVVFDDARWVRGATAYVGDLTAYRIYMINHEDGHALGHEHAHECLPNGYAPAMMQQTIGLTDPHTHKLCAANPWPYPPGVAGAPGAEQPDTPQNSEFGVSGD